MLIDISYEIMSSTYYTLFRAFHLNARVESFWAKERVAVCLDESQQGSQFYVWGWGSVAGSSR